MLPEDAAVTLENGDSLFVGDGLTGFRPNWPDDAIQVHLGGGDIPRQR